MYLIDHVHKCKYTIKVLEGNIGKICMTLGLAMTLDITQKT